VWGWDFIGDSARWMSMCAGSGRKIELDSSVPTRIVTVRGGGYRFEG